MLDFIYLAYRVTKSWIPLRQKTYVDRAFAIAGARTQRSGNCAQQCARFSHQVIRDREKSLNFQV